MVIQRWVASLGSEGCALTAAGGLKNRIGDIFAGINDGEDTIPIIDRSNKGRTSPFGVAGENLGTMSVQHRRRGLLGHAFEAVTVKPVTKTWWIPAEGHATGYKKCGIIRRRGIGGRILLCHCGDRPKASSSQNYDNP